MTEELLHVKLTQLLMDNGCSVTKKGIYKLVDYIANRDEQIIKRVIRDAERTLAEIQRETYHPEETL